MLGGFCQFLRTGRENEIHGAALVASGSNHSEFSGARAEISLGSRFHVRTLSQVPMARAGEGWSGGRGFRPRLGEAPIAGPAFTNTAAIYDILFMALAEAALTFAADRKRLGAKVGITSVLHTWGSAMTHGPHGPMIAPG